VGNLPEFLVMCLLMLRTTISHGLCGQSGVGLIGYALICNNLNDMGGAHRFSALSRQVLERTKAKHLEAIQMLVVAHWITGWRDPHPQVLTVFERGYRSGMETGDFENALLCLTSGYHHEYAAGYPLPILDAKYAQLTDRLRMYKIDAILVMSLEQWRKIQHLMGQNNSGGLPLDVNELGTFGPGRHNDGSEKYRLLYGMCEMFHGMYGWVSVSCSFIWNSILSKLTSWPVVFCSQQVIFAGWSWRYTLDCSNLQKSWPEKHWRLILTSRFLPTHYVCFFRV
jgi:hypothetical protein